HEASLNDPRQCRARDHEEKPGQDGHGEDHGSAAGPAHRGPMLQAPSIGRNGKVLAVHTGGTPLAKNAASNSQEWEGSRRSQLHPSLGGAHMRTFIVLALTA